MQNRTRNRQLNLKFIDDEFEYIKAKKDLAQSQNYTDFILKIAIHSNIYNIDTMPLIEVAKEINKIGVNINQIAKVVNTSGNIYENESKICKTRLSVWRKLPQTLILILKK